MSVHQGVDGSPSSQPPRDPRGERIVPVWGVFEILTALFAVLVIMGVLFALAAVIISLVGVSAASPQEDPVGAPILLLTQAVLDAAAVGVAAWISLRRRKLGARAWLLRPHRPFAVSSCVMVLVGSFLAIAVYSGIVQALGISDLKPRENVPEFFFSEPRVVPFALLLVVVVAPLAEEMFFRAFIFRGLIGTLGVYGAAAASGFLFALIHVSSPDLIGLVVPFTIIGFLFAVLVAKTGSLYNSILVHFSFNLLSALENLLKSRPGLGLAIAILFIAALYTMIWRIQVARGVNRLRNDTV